MSRDDDLPDEARRAVESRDWSNAVVDWDPRPPTGVFATSVRLTGDQLTWFANEAERHNLNPSEMIQELVLRAYRQATAARVCRGPTTPATISP